MGGAFSCLKRRKQQHKAEISAETPAPSGEPLFITRLPPEVRLVVYRHLFRGHVNILTPYRFGARSRENRKGQPEVFRYRDTTRWQVLLACKLCYVEGRRAFWEESRLLCLAAGDSSRFLPRCVGDLARVHLRHLRGITVDPKTADVLRRFPSLETCEFMTQCRLIYAEGWEELVNEAAWAGWVCRNVLEAPSPVAYLERYGLAGMDVSFAIHVWVRMRTGHSVYKVNHPENEWFWEI